MQRIKLLFQNKFMASNFLMFFGAMLLNAGAYLYHYLMQALLGPQGYGGLSALFSILYLLISPAMVLNVVVVRFVAEAQSRDDLDFVASLFYRSLKTIFLAGFLCTLVFVFLAESITQFLNIDSTWSVTLVGATALLLFATMFNRSIMQGLTRFGYFSMSGLLETVLKVVLAVALIGAGLSVFGGFAGIFLADAIVFAWTWWVINGWLSGYRRDASVPYAKMLKFAPAVFFSLTAMTSFFSTDIILVKHFFEPLQAGYYAFLAIAGKIIFFVSSSVVMVLLPFVAQRQEKGERVSHYLFLSLAAVLALSGTGVLVYFFWPQLVIFIFRGYAYLPAAPLLGIFGLFILLYALCYTLVNFFLAVGLVRVAVLPVAFNILQIGLIWFWHQSLEQVIGNSIISLSLLLLCLLLYFAYAKARHKIR